MDNKYALGSTRVSTEHHELHHKAHTHLACKFCNRSNLVLSPTMHDHHCADCGEWQNDVEKGYPTGRSNDY